MTHKIDAKLLHGAWLHAHEEDTPGKAVFRPDTYALPPSRGRTGYKFEPDGSVLKIGPGPADRGSSTGGTWQINSQGRVEIHIPGASPEEFEIDELTSDCFVLKK